MRQRGEQDETGFKSLYTQWVLNHKKTESDEENLHSNNHFGFDFC